MQQATPFTRIAADNSDFFEDDYIPRDLTIKSPRLMKQHQLLTFFRHVSAREQTHGIHNAFQFKCVLSGRKKGSLQPVQYVAGASAGGTSMVATTQPETQRETVGGTSMVATTQPETQRETVELGTSGGVGGTSIVPNTSQPETPLEPAGAGAAADPVQRSRVVPRLRGPATLGPATEGPAPASASRLQTSDLLALEEAKQWEVSGKCRHQ